MLVTSPVTGFSFSEGKIGSVPLKDLDFRKIPLKVSFLVKYHPKPAPFVVPSL
jgi:hypothetical protein